MAAGCSQGSSIEAMEPNRKVMAMSVAALLKEAGFSVAEGPALGSLLEMTIAYVSEVARSSKQLAELGGRANVIHSDVSLALANMGCSLERLPNSMRRGGRITILAPLAQQQQVTPTPLHVGRSLPKPGYIPDYLPPYPDPHTYVRTESTVKPSDNYVETRVTMAKHHDAIRRSLARYQSLVQPDSAELRCSNRLFKLMRPSSLHPYLTPLLAPQEDESEAATASDSAKMASAASAQGNSDNPFVRGTKILKEY